MRLLALFAQDSLSLFVPPLKAERRSVKISEHSSLPHHHANYCCSCVDIATLSGANFFCWEDCTPQASFGVHMFLTANGQGKKEAAAMERETGERWGRRKEGGRKMKGRGGRRKRVAKSWRWNRDFSAVNERAARALCVYVDI